MPGSGVLDVAQLVHPEVFHPQAPWETKLLGVKDEFQEQGRNLLEVPIHRSRSITPPPKYDIQHQATCFFLNLFSFQASKKYGIPILDFLPDMLDQSKAHTAIYAASTAVSRMTLADQYSGSDARLLTNHEYTKALKSVARIMSDEKEAVKDEAVTAVWLLGLYEVCFPSPVSALLMYCRLSTQFWRMDVAIIHLETWTKNGKLTLLIYVAR